ncbi:MAG TPA: hypothetical protein VN668_18010 [Stellaceae bacterium]|nr:hypothetical protein [Stellaceae bacterium]
MPDIDPLSFAIAYALTHKTGGALKRAVRSLPDDDLDRAAQIVADHLRSSGWRHVPVAIATGDQFPGASPPRQP